jgi:hypothetical protein
MNIILTIIIFIITILVIPYCLSEIIKGKDVRINITIIMTQIPSYIKMLHYICQQ